MRVHAHGKRILPGEIAVIAAALLIVCASNAAAEDKDWLGLTSEPYAMKPSRNVKINPVTYYRTRMQARRAFAAGDHAKAARLFEMLTRAYPDDGDNWLLLGHSRTALRTWKAAASAYETALKYGAFPFDLTGDVNPNDTMVKIARAHAQSGNKEKSIAWLERALEYRYDDRIELRKDDAFGPIKDDPRFLKAAGLLPGEPASRVKGWRGDLAYLRAEMERLHPVMTHRNSRKAIDAAFRAAEAKIAKSNDFQMTAEIGRLLGLLGNGHNLLLPFPANHGGFVQFPLKFYQFTDGIYVIDATEGHSDLIGARVIRFGNMTAEDALTLLEPFVARDNNTQIGFLGALWLTTPHVLEAAGIIEDAERASLQLEMPDGRVRTIQKLPLQPFKLDTYGLRSSDATVKRALYLSNFDETLWMRRLPRRRMLYLQMTNVQPCCDMTIAQFAEKARRAADDMKAKYLVIDLRNNAGGNSYLGMGIVKLAAYFEASRGQGSVFVMFGRNSLSAAHTLIVDIDRVIDAVFVGELSGSSANAYAESGWFRLPYSGVFGFISSQLHQYSWPEDHRIWIAPHVPVSLTSKDYFAGRDPAMEAIFQIIGAK